MKNIIEICKDFGIEIPADKHAEFNKVVAENYKTIAEFEKKVNRLTDDLATEKNRADTAEEALKGFEGINPTDVKTQLEEANKKVKEAQEAAEKKIAERDFNDALKAALEGIEFTSAAAKKSIEAEIRTADLKLKNGQILGLSDLIDQLKKEDASAFVDKDQQQMERDKPRFTSPTGNNLGGTTTVKEIMKIKDPVERQKMIGQNMHLFGRKGE